MPVIISDPSTFTFGQTDTSLLLGFNIPAGNWASGQWTRTYTATRSGSIQQFMSTGSSHHANWPTSHGTPTSPVSDAIALTSNQLIDINAIASTGGGVLPATYGRVDIEPFVTQYVISLTLTLISAGGSTLMRFERATVYEGAQFGVESTPGTRVAANKRLLGLEIDLENMTDIKPYRPQGNKFNTTAQHGKEWTQGRLQGILCYNDLIYLASSWLTTASPTVPVNNSAFTLTNASGTIGFTYKGSVLAPASFANAAALQTAIEALPSVGAGNVIVTGAAPSYTVTFRGALSTDQSAITSPTGTPLPVVTLEHAATLTNRWSFLMQPAGPDDIITMSIEKGAAGVANMAQSAAFGFVGGLRVKMNKDEASFTGDFIAQKTTDPFTMTSSPTDVACIPVNSSDINVWIGTSLVGPAHMDRILDYEFGVDNRASGLMTLNADDPSFSNRIEMAPGLTAKFFQEHDAAGQVMLSRLRAGTKIFTIIESTGPLIEAGFPYRMKWTFCTQLVKPTPADMDGAYGRNYDGELCYDTSLAGAIKLEIDSVLSTL